MENVATNETSSLLDDITSLEELDAIEYLSAEGLLINVNHQPNTSLFEIDIDEFFKQDSPIVI
jgi:hypothetical protein